MRVLLVRPRVLNAITIFGALDCEPLELNICPPPVRRQVIRSGSTTGSSPSDPIPVWWQSSSRMSWL